MLTAVQVGASEPTTYWYRRAAIDRGLGSDIPGVDTVKDVSKTIYYVGVGTALIVGALFVWKLTDAIFGD
jgi:hypothetical protein